MTLEVRGVTWAPGERRIVDDVSFTVAEGTFTGLLGPNGSGKTSLLRTIARLHAGGTGTMLLSGVDLSRLSRRELARVVAVVEQDATTETDLRVRDVVGLGRTPHGNRLRQSSSTDAEACDRALASTGCASLADRPFLTLSGGERQRVHLARAVAQEPDLLVLDEPTNHLDVSAQTETLRLVRDLGVTTVAALHDINLAAAYCDHLVVLRAGRVVASGTPTEVLSSALLLEVYGVQTSVVPHPRDGRPLVVFDRPR
jgi:iron complex transport system ATP-binding protein